MKKLFVFLICISFCATFFSFASSAETTTYNITEIEGKYKTQGRTDIVDGTLFLDWSASGIEFNANCSGDVSIKVNTSRIKTGGADGLYFTVIVDGVVQYENQRIPSNNNANSWKSNSTNYPFKIENQGVCEFTIAKNLQSGSHTFEIYNQTEPFHGTFGIQSITLHGELLPPKSNNDLYIEFVGDSIIAGLGNISVGGTGAALYQDATRGWPYLAAKKLKADWSIIAQSGITASDGIGWSGPGTVSMKGMYPKTRYLGTKNYSFDPSPDVIVICLGTNDIWTYQSGGKTLDYLEKEFISMLKIIRTKNPSSKIVWTYGMMINDADTLIKTAVEKSGGADKGIYSLYFPKNVDGGQGHPGIAIQKTYAEIVTDFINEILFGKTKDDDTQSKPTSSISSSNTDNKKSKPQNTSTTSTNSNKNNSQTNKKDNVKTSSDSNGKSENKSEKNSSSDSGKNINSQDKSSKTDGYTDQIKNENNDENDENTVSTLIEEGKITTSKVKSNNKLLINIFLIVIDVALVGFFVFIFIRLKRKK